MMGMLALHSHGQRRLRKKPFFGPKRVGFLGTVILSGMSGIISWIVVWIPILYLRLQVMLTQNLFSVVFFVAVYAPLWVIGQVVVRYLIWRGRSET